MRRKIIIKTLRDSTLLTSFKRFSLSYNKKHILIVSRTFASASSNLCSLSLYTIHRTPSYTQKQYNMLVFAFIFFNIFYISCQHWKLTTVELKLLSLVLTPGRMFRVPRAYIRNWRAVRYVGIFCEKKRCEIFCNSDVLTQNDVMPVMKMWFINI